MDLLDLEPRTCQGVVPGDIVRASFLVCVRHSTGVANHGSQNRLQSQHLPEKLNLILTFRAI
jgi:hypothetical protein